jgi:hypothetical protein
MQRFGYELDHAGIGGSFLIRRKDFSLLQITQGMKITAHLYLELRVRMSKAAHAFTHIPSSNAQT